ncbi:MAG: hypothetical protein HYZ28_03600 [Myxococcales bacterium]|nr:hypothetical protein [Myxococcales bacterium]
MKKTILAVAIGAVIGCVTTQALAERQPRMKEALHHLHQAKDALEKGSPDKGGHRVKAIAFVKDAIIEVEKGIAFDDRH